MIPHSTIALSAVIIFTFAASTAVAKKSGGLPALDLKYSCQASAKAVEAMTSSTSDVYSSCVSDEQAARDQLQKDWASFDADNKARCIQPQEEAGDFNKPQTAP